MEDVGVILQQQLLPFPGIFEANFLRPVEQRLF